jgi:ATP-binding cassette subfamily B protein
MFHNPLFKIINTFFQLLSSREKTRFYLLIFGMFITSFLEVVSIGLVIPVMTILFKPQLILSNEYFLFFYVKFFNLNLNYVDLIITLLFVFFILISTFSRVFLLKRLLYEGNFFAKKFSINLFEQHLALPYIDFTRKNSSELQSNLFKVSEIGTWFITPLLTIFSSIIMVVFIFIFLIFLINSYEIFFFIMFFVLVYYFLNNYFKLIIKTNSELLDIEHINMIKLVQEANGAFREIKIDNLKNDFLNYYFKSLSKFRNSWFIINFLNQSPKFFVEAFAIISLSIFSLYFRFNGGDFDSALIIMGALVLSLQRILPVLQNIFISVRTINTHFPSIQTILNLLRDYYEHKLNYNFLFSEGVVDFYKSIELRDISFRYSYDSKLIVDNFSLKINKGDRIGIVGTSGSGKSTILDLLMGLLEPNMGQLIVDDVVINSVNLCGWQNNISHVPQNIFLKDSSILENIALGVPVEFIDLERVKVAVQKAMLHDFIESLPSKIDTIVGELGVRLSGGQKQRIGIARAFYKNSNLIILDEATSALDDKTELDIVKSLNMVDSSLTIIVVAHRISSLNNCNKIVDLSNSNFVMYSSYEEFLKYSS